MWRFPDGDNDDLRKAVTTCCSTAILKLPVMERTITWLLLLFLKLMNAILTSQMTITKKKGDTWKNNA